MTGVLETSDVKKRFTSIADQVTDPNFLCNISIKFYESFALCNPSFSRFLYLSGRFEIRIPFFRQFSVTS